MFRFGITSRITESSDYFEIRNSLSQDWANYFYENFPDDIWVTIPNQGSKSIEYFKSLKLNVLILLLYIQNRLLFQFLLLFS